MAIELGTAYISILPSTSKIAPAIKGALRNVEAEAGRSGARAGLQFKSGFADKVSSFLKKGILGAAGGASLLGAAGVKTASDLEQMNIGFTTMLGSGKKAQKFMAEITKFAKNTPFDMPGVAKASEKLLAFGFNAKDVMPTLTALGDAASGLGLGAEGLDQLTTAIGQMKAKGKVQGDELLQLTEAGIPALKILANGFHTSTGAMQKMVSKGLVPSNKAIPILLKGIEKGTKGAAGQTTRFGGLMQKQSKSLAGIFSNLKDTVLVGLAGAIKPLLPLIEKGMTAAIKALTPAIQRLGHWVKDTLVPGLQSFSDWISKHKTLIKDLAIGIGGIAAAVVAYSTAMKVARGITAAYTTVMGIMKGFQIVWIALTEGMTAAQVALDAAMDANPIGAVILAITALVAALVIAYKKSDTFRKIVNAVFSFLKHAVVTVIGFVKDHWKLILPIILGPLGLLIVGVATHWNKVKDIIQGVWKHVIEPVFHAIAWTIKNILVPVIKTIWDVAVKPVFGWIGKYIAKIWNDGVKPVFKALAGWIGDHLVPAFQKGISRIGDIWSSLQRMAAVPVNFIIDHVYNNGIRKLWNSIPGGTDLPKIPLVTWGQRTYSHAGGSGYSSAAAKNSSRFSGAFATGGVLPGYTPGRDVHTFYSPTGGTLRLSGGEAIMRPEWTRMMGGPAAVAQMNALAKRGRHASEGFASGGVFSNPSRPVVVDGKTISAIAAAQLRLAEEVSKTRLYIMQGGFGGSHIAASGSSHNYPGVMDVGPASIAMEKVMRQVGFAAWARNISGRSSVGSGAHIHAVSLLDPGDKGSPQVYGSWANHGNGLSGYGNDPAPHYAWLPNLLKRLGAVNLSALGGGGTGGGGIDFSGIIQDAKDVFSKVGGWMSELTHMGGWMGMAKSIVKGIVERARGWVNKKIPGPGPIPGIFDNGGVLEPGHYAFNASTRPEAVFNHQQFRALANTHAASRRPSRVELNVEGRKFSAWMREIASDEVDAASEFASTQRRMR